MKNHTIRCLKTLSCLPRYPGRITTSGIHRRLQDEGFSVSLRTLQRDLESLSGSFPIGSEHQGRSLAWYWTGKATLFSIPSMDAYTALTFLLAETNMQALFPAGIRASMTPYFDAARDVLVKQNRRHLKNWKEKIRFAPRGQPLKPAHIRPEVVRAVHEALLQDKRLFARYRKREESRGKEREINPLALLHGDSVSYLVCTFGDYTDVWHLPLHRFSSARLLEKSVTRPDGFDLEKYLSEEQALQYPWGGEIRPGRPVRRRGCGPPARDPAQRAPDPALLPRRAGAGNRESSRYPATALVVAGLRRPGGGHRPRNTTGRVCRNRLGDVQAVSKVG